MNRLLILVVVGAIVLAFGGYYFTLEEEVFVDPFPVDLLDACEATAENPILPQSLQTSRSANTSITFCVYNAESNILQGAKIVLFNCRSPDGTVAAPFTITTHNTLRIPPHQPVRIPAVLELSNVPVGTHICHLRVQGDSGSVGPVDVGVTVTP
jgi:hypothetical protein